MSRPLTSLLAQTAPAEVTDALRKQVDGLANDIAHLQSQADALKHAVWGEAHNLTRLEIFHGYAPVMVVSFLVTLCMTPVMRRLAVRYGVIDRPSEARKVHRQPIAYLGGAAVFVGLMAGVMYSFLAVAFPSLIDFHQSQHLQEGIRHAPVPPSIVLGMTVIALIGLIDDVMGISPRVKVGGQLLAAAALAIDDVGVRVAGGVMKPIGALFGDPNLVYHIHLPMDIPFLAPGGVITFDLVYWTGTAIIAIFVLGACNASNLIDGLDGLLTGVTGTATAGLLILALGLAYVDDGPRDAQRIILCLALLGACLGFLPHNFNPATIFLGDCGSLLMGFTTIVIILTLGDTEKTFLVFAGLIVYAIPLIDTSLAIVRRKLAGKSISSADSDHLHHMLKRALGVKGAVLTLYGIGMAFAALGVWMSFGRARVVYILTLVLASFIGVTAIKIARRKQIEDQAAAFDAAKAAANSPSTPANTPASSTAAAPIPAPLAAPAAGPAHGAASTNPPVAVAEVITQA